MSAASGENQSVMSPRCTSARSYSAQLLTRYFVLYLGWTLEFMLRMWPIGPKGPPRPGQLANFLYDSCTNALHHNQTVPPAIPDPREQRPEGTVDRTKLRPRPSMSETRELMAQGHILGDEICTVLENGSNNEENRWEFERHLRIIVSVPMCRKSQQFCRSVE